MRNHLAVTRVHGNIGNAIIAQIVILAILKCEKDKKAIFDFLIFIGNIQMWKRRHLAVTGVHTSSHSGSLKHSSDTFWGNCY